MILLELKMFLKKYENSLKLFFILEQKHWAKQPIHEKRLVEFRSMLSHKNFKKNDRFMITSIALKFLTKNCSKSDFNYLY